MVITGIGGTDYYPSHDNAETLMVTVLVVLGALMWAKVLATFCDLHTNADPTAVEYRQALDDLNRFCRDHGLASGLKRRLRQYFHRASRGVSTDRTMASPRRRLQVHVRHTLSSWQSANM